MEASPNSPSYCHTSVSQLWVSRMLAFSSSILHQNPKFLRIYITLKKQWTSPLFPTCYPITGSRASSNWKRTPRISSPCSGWVEVNWRDSREVKKEGPVCAKPWCLEPLRHWHDRSVEVGWECLAIPLWKCRLQCGCPWCHCSWLGTDFALLTPSMPGQLS